jgi:hypothetical protein
MQYFSYTAILLLCFNFTANAALPRLSQEDLEAYSTNIVEGRVISVKETNVVKYRTNSDYHYRVKMEVTKSIKGTNSPGNIITFHYWSANQRPDGYSDDMGLYENRQKGLSIRAGANIRVYTYVDEKGKNQVVNPNGFKVIEEPEEDYIIFINVPN